MDAEDGSDAKETRLLVVSFTVFYSSDVALFTTEFLGELLLCVAFLARFAEHVAIEPCERFDVELLERGGAGCAVLGVQS